MIRIKCTLHSISADAGELNRPIDRDYLLHGRYKCVVEISPKPDNIMYVKSSYVQTSDNVYIRTSRRVTGSSVNESQDSQRSFKHSSHWG